MLAPPEWAGNPDRLADFGRGAVAAGAVPDPLHYAEWFKQAPEKQRRVAVGTRRYSLLRDKGLHADYANFVNPETGELLPLSVLDDETVTARRVRVKQFNALAKQQKNDLARMATYGFLPPVPPKPPAVKVPTPRKPKPPKKTEPAGPPKPQPARPSPHDFSQPAGLLKTLAEHEHGKAKVAYIAGHREKEEKLIRAARLARADAEAAAAKYGHALRYELSTEADKKAALEAMKAERRAAEAAADDLANHLKEARENVHKALAAHAPTKWQEKFNDFLVLNETVDDYTRTSTRKATEFLGHALDATGVTAPKLTASVEPLSLLMGERANYRPGTQTVRAGEQEDAHTMVHELGHHIEEVVAGVKEAAHAFLKHRVGDEQPQEMIALFPGSNYNPGERGRRDKFDAHFPADRAYYVGKDYGPTATEVVSMGLEALYQDPVGFAHNDPEYCQFILGILDGTFRTGGGGIAL